MEEEFQESEMSCPWIYSGSMEQLRLKPIVLCVHAQLLQSCLTLCDPMDCGPPASSVQGILQARILQWVAISLSTIPGYVSKEIKTLIQKDTYTPVFIVAIFCNRQYMEAI